jgi:dethiobiotin synthase
MRGLFITGTDTGVGKTVVSAALLHRYRSEFPLLYWKPIQTGIEQDNDTAVVRLLGGCREPEVLDSGIRLRLPVSPHLAAQLAGVKIDLTEIASIVRRRPTPVSLLVEGAGGALVPVNESEMATDLMAILGLGIVVVARTALGTINHTLLTLEALRSRSLQVAGVILAGHPDPHNREAIRQFGNVAILGEMPLFPSLTRETLSAWASSELDPSGLLRRHLE